MLKATLFTLGLFVWCAVAGALCALAAYFILYALAGGIFALLTFVPLWLVAILGTVFVLFREWRHITSRITEEFSYNRNRTDRF